MTLNKMDIKSTYLLGWQIPIITDNSYGNAKILKIEDSIILNHFKKVEVIVIAGFQGISSEGNITSLGRGGSDTTAVAISIALKTLCKIPLPPINGIFFISSKIKSSPINRPTR